MIGRKFFRVLLYLTSFSFLVFIFAVYGLDTDLIKRKVEAGIAERSGLEVSIGSLRVSPPITFQMSNVTTRDASGTELRFSNLAVSFLVPTMTSAAPTLRLSTVQGIGELELDLTTGFFDREKLSVTLRSREFPTAEVLKRVNGGLPPMSGDVDAEGFADLRPDDLSGMTGSLEVDLKNLTFLNGMLAGLALDTFKPDSVSCLLRLERRVLETKPCFAETPGGKFELRITSRLSDHIMDTPLSGLLVVTPTANKFESLLMMYGKYQKADGAYHFPLKGSFAYPGLVL